MICPNCHTEIELTWKRYVASPLSRFDCTECSTRFKLVRPIYYWLLPLALLISTFGGGVAVINLLIGDFSGYITFALILLIVILSSLFLVVDKNWENKLETVAIEASASNDDSP
jgi:hypothetical protein